MRFIAVMSSYITELLRCSKPSLKILPAAARMIQKVMINGSDNIGNPRCMSGAASATAGRDASG